MTETHLVNASPFADLAETDPWFRAFESAFFPGVFVRAAVPDGGPERTSSLAVAFTDVVDRGAAYELAVDLPGFAKNEIAVRVHGSSVDIRAEHAAEAKSDDANYLRHERRWSGFHRQVELPETVRGEDVAAKFENGVLTVSVPKAHPASDRQVPVQ